jgi:peptide/nickel transport system substrate-binding protein
MRRNRGERGQPVLRWLVVLAIAGLVAAATVFAVTSPAAGQKAEAATMVVNIAQAPSTLDPAQGCLAFEVGFIGNFYARLTQYGSKPGPNGTTQVDPAHMKPWLAQSWTITNGGRTYTFKLRPGLRFPSGRAVTASDVKYSIERSIKMLLCGYSFVLDNRFTPALIKSIATPNPDTVVFHLSGPDQNFLQDLTMPAAGVVDRTVVQAHGGVKAGKVNAYMSSHVAGYGPYLLQSYIPNKQAVLTANPTFFQPAPVKRIVVNFISDDSTLLLQARSGKTDVTLGLSKQAVHSLKGNACCRLIVDNSPLAQQVVFNNTKAPFTSKLFREALTYAVPYQDILSRIVYGYGKLYYGEWVPYFPWFNAKIGKPRTFDLKKAGALLAQSKVSLPVSFPLLIPEGDTVAEQIATTLQAVWKQLKVNITINKESSADYLNTLNAHKFQAATYYDGPGVIAPDYYWGYDAECGIVYSYTLFCSHKADHYIRELWTTTNPAKRQALTDAANRIWIAGSPAIKVYADEYVSVLGPKVTRFQFQHLSPDFRTWAIK